MSTTTPTREPGTADGAASDAPATGRASVPRPSRRRTDPLYQDRKSTRLNSSH